MDSSVIFECCVFPHEQQHVVRTVSGSGTMGQTLFVTLDENTTKLSSLVTADEALYRAKENDRGQTCGASNFIQNTINSENVAA